MRIASFALVYLDVGIQINLKYFVQERTVNL